MDGTEEEERAGVGERGGGVAGDIVLVITWHFVGEKGEEGEARTEDDTPAAGDDERPGNGRDEMVGG